MTKCPLLVIERYDSGKEFSKCWVVETTGLWFKKNMIQEKYILKVLKH